MSTIKPPNSGDERFAAIQEQLQKMRDTLSEIQHDFSSSIDAMQSNMAELIKQGEKLDIQMTGGDKPENGIIVRVDRLEMWRFRLQWVMKVTGGALIVATIGALITFIKGEK